MRRSCNGGQIGSAAKAGVQAAGIAQLRERFFEERLTLALLVWRIRSANVGTFIPINAEPDQIGNLLIDESLA